MGVDRAAAHQPLVELELAERLEQLAGGGDDLGADPVAGQDDYARGVAHAADSTRSGSGGDGLDVEADVVERQRLLGSAARTASAKGSRSSSGSGRGCGAEGDRRDERRSGSRGLHRLRLQPAARLGEAGARAGAPRSPPAPAKFQRPSSPLEVRRVARRRRRPRRSPARCAATLPSPPHWATRRPPGRSAARRRAEEPVVVGDPVEGRGREDEVDRLVELQLGEVGDAGSRRGRRAARAPSRPSPRSRRPRSRCPCGSRSSSSAVTRPEPQPASSAASSPRSSSRSSTSIPHSNCGIGDARRRSRRPTRGRRCSSAPRRHALLATAPS